MSRKSKVTDVGLNNLEQAVGRLVEVFAIELAELRTEVFDLRNRVEGYSTAGDDSVTLEDVLIAEVEAESERTGPYRLVDSVELYVSGDGDVYDTAIELLQEARAANADPTNLLVGVQYVPAGADGEGAYFAGHVAVSL